MQLAARQACNLHVWHAPGLLIRRRRSGLADQAGFIQVRIWDLATNLFQSITGDETLLASSNASDTDGGGTECAQTFWSVLARGLWSSSATRSPPSCGPEFPRR